MIPTKVWEVIVEGLVSGRVKVGDSFIVQHDIHYTCKIKENSIIAYPGWMTTKELHDAETKNRIPEGATEEAAQSEASNSAALADQEKSGDPS